MPFLNQYALQVDDLAYAAWGERAQRFPAQDAIRNMQVIDACLQSATERSRVQLY
ncbi:hypothetical protein D3C86_2140510 [compost metagenome]